MMGSENHKKIIDSNTGSGLRPDIVLCAVLVVATLCVYGQIWTHEFIGFDDDRYVTQNRIVSQGLSREGVIWAFRSTHVSNWHPITWISHMVDCQLFGIMENPYPKTQIMKTL